MNKHIFKLSTTILLLFFIASCDRATTLDTVPSSYLTVDDSEIHYKEYGEGEKTLIFVHGWGCDLNTWKYQFDHFQNEHRLVFIDLPGYGKSDKTERQYTLDLFAKSVLAVVNDLDTKKPVLIAHSMGLPVCIEVIKRMKNDNAKLCNIDGVYFNFPTDSIELQNYKKGLNEFANMFKGEKYETNVEEFVNGFVTKDTPSDVSNYILSTMTKTPEFVGYSSMKSLIDEKYWDKEMLTTQTLAIYAKMDELPPNNENILKEQFPNLTYKEMEGVNHFLMMEKANEVNQILEEFIKK